ncbi:MAG: Photosystem I reaction center subunit III [Prochlorothrix sp.]|nr:Photosystem I reaction center subunit III [Prochlorothrix sp.]
MRRLFALVLTVCLWFSAVPAASAAVAGLTPCSESAAFIARAEAAATPQAQARFERYASALCGEEGLPHLIVDGRWSHAGDFIIPGLMFLYIAGWIGWVGRSYLIAIHERKNPVDYEIFIDAPLAMQCALSGFTWPVAAFQAFSSGTLTVKDSEVTTSPR